MNNPAKLILPIVALILLIAPVSFQWLQYHYPGIQSGFYDPPEIPELDSEKINATLPDYNARFVDDPIEGQGRVVFDLSQANNLELNDLAPLKDRLEARGAEIIALAEDDDLDQALRGATAMVILAPTEPYEVSDRETIVKFVEDGGRLLLAADPTRNVPPSEDEFLSLFDIFFPESAIPAINSIANAFEISYIDDYLYNLEENEGNYRNVKFRDFATDHPLTNNLNTVVFFASYSLRGDGPAIVQGDSKTNSPVRTGEINLPAAMLTTNEQVLALGDLTILTPPYHTIADNNQFLSNIADWLAVDERQRELEDFPYLFTTSTINLVQTSQEFLDPRLIAQSNVLQELFDEADMTLTLSATANPDNDVLYVGTFDKADLVESYLLTAGITITVKITPTEKLTDTEGLELEDEIGGAVPSITNTTVITDDELAPVEDDLELPAGEEDEPLEDETIIEEELEEEAAEEADAADEEGDAEEDGEADDEEAQAAEEDGETEDGEAEAEDEEEADDEEEEDEETVLLDIERIGKIGAEGTSLYLVDRTGDQLRIIVLAEDGENAIAALDRLVSGDFSQCATNDNLVICSTGEAQDGLGLDAKEEGTTTEEETEGKLGSIFIMADDDGPEGSRTGAAEWETILSDLYDVTIWSTNDDGIPTSDDVTGYDVYIIDSGDYAADPDDFETFFAFAGVEDGAGVMFIGAQPLPTPVDEADFQPLDDLEVTDDTHPVAEGFTEGDIITLEPSESDIDPVVIPNPDDLYNDATIVLSRGPDSPEAGTPVVIAATDTTSESRIILATFPFYRLPDEPREIFGLNAAAWLMGE